MLEVTSIRNLRPREGKEALHLVFSPALFPPPPTGGLRTGGGAGFPASSALIGDTRRDRDYVTKEAGGTEFSISVKRLCREKISLVFKLTYKLGHSCRTRLV
jgi:hypothetical protein